MLTYIHTSTKVEYHTIHRATCHYDLLSQERFSVHRHYGRLCPPDRGELGLPRLEGLEPDTKSIMDKRMIRRLMNVCPLPFLVCDYHGRLGSRFFEGIGRVLYVMLEAVGGTFADAPSLHVTSMAKHLDPNHSLCPHLPIPPLPPKVLCIALCLARPILINLNIVRRAMGHSTIGQIHARKQGMDG